MRMFRTLGWAAAAAIAAVVFTGQASAGPIISAAGNTACVLYDSSSCTTQEISLHSAWQGNNPNGRGAKWVSYADTGPSGSTLAPPNGHTDNPDGKTVIMTVSETITTTANSVKLYLDVWSDDTAGVILNGTEIFAPNFTQNICADGAIGCEPGEQAMITEVLAAGMTHTIDLEVYQVGDGTNNAANPFGLLYSGKTKELPEPATLGLMGLGLAGLGFVAHRRRRSAA